MFYLPHNPCIALRSVNEPLGKDEGEAEDWFIEIIYI